jgi:hypothetical protein
MKTKIILIALFVAAFMFPSIGSVNTADALGNYGCSNQPQADHIRCLRTLLHDNAPRTLSSPSNDGLGNWGCGRPTFSAHRDCLRSILDQHAPGLAARMAGSNGNTYSTMPDGNSGSNYNHLRDPMATGGVNGVEANNHSCTQFSGAPRRACEAAAMNPAHGSNVQNNHCATFFGPARASCEARNP